MSPSPSPSASPLVSGKEKKFSNHEPQQYSRYYANRSCALGKSLSSTHVLNGKNVQSGDGRFGGIVFVEVWL